SGTGRYFFLGISLPARLTLLRSSLRLSRNLSLTMAVASLVVFIASSAMSRVFWRVMSKAFFANSVCFTSISCGFPVGLKSRTIADVSRNAVSMISRCFGERFCPLSCDLGGAPERVDVPAMHFDQLVHIDLRHAEASSELLDHIEERLRCH